MIALAEIYIEREGCPSTEKQRERETGGNYGPRAQLLIDLQSPRKSFGLY